MIIAIVLTPDGFVRKGGWFFRRKGQWTAIKSIHAAKMDMFTYEEDFLFLNFGFGGSISVGEMDGGFSAFEAALINHLPGFDTEWQTKAAIANAGDKFLVWRRS